MRILALLLVALAAFWAEPVLAAKKKPAAPPTPKAIYEAPMRVVIARNSQPTCEPNCPEWIAAEGEIMDGTPSKFRAVFKQMGKRKLPIVIRSPGGSIDAALAIGRMIRERGLSVAVGYTSFSGCAPDSKSCKLPKEANGVYQGTINGDGSFCNSACPLILAGGEKRLVSNYNFLGLHEIKTTWTREQVRYREYYKIVKGRKVVTQRKTISRKIIPSKTTFGISKPMRKKLTAYYKSMGVDVAIVDEMAKTKFKDITDIPSAQRHALKIITDSRPASYLAAPRACSAAETEHCVYDKSRDPAVKVMKQRKAVGIPEDAAAMTFRVVRSGDPACGSACPMWIAADGVITPASAQDLRKVVESLVNTKLPIIFNSPGGDAVGATELAGVIRLNDLETAVGKTIGDASSGATVTPEGICNGACVMAFVGGKERHIAKEQKFVMHPAALYGDAPVLVKVNTNFSYMRVSQDAMTQLHEIKDGKTRTYGQAELLTLAIGTDAQPLTEMLAAFRCRQFADVAGCPGV
jgi:hypothetical protein